MKKFNVPGSLAMLVIALCLGLASCSSDQTPSASAEQEPGSDPAQANLAPAGSAVPAQPVAVPAQQAAAPAQQAPPQQQPYEPQPQQTYAPPPPSDQNYDQNYAAGADDSGYGEQPVYAEQPPPPIPEYTQPACPGENYIWTPGYWSYASEGYYWVPGAWVLAPYVGALWTPPYWAYAGSRYLWHHGYWAPHIGFYGGINYGFGYVGHGYEGGYWNRDVFRYNRVVNNVNINVVHNVYNYRITNFTESKVSYDGGRGGLNERPTARELEVLHEQRMAAVPAQVQHRQQAASDRAQFDAVNHGRPQTFAVARPLPTEYRAPAAHPTAVPGARMLPRPNVGQEAMPTQQRSEERANPMTRTAQPRTEQRPAEQRQPQQLPAQQRQFEQRQPQQPSPQQRPAEQRQSEQRPVPQARPETRYGGQQPTPQPRTEQRPAPEARPQAQPRTEQRPAPQPQMQQRPAPQARPEQRPAPQPRTEERSMPQRPAQEARPEARPAAQPRTEQRPAPQAREEARPAPQGHQEARPNQKKEEQHPH